MKKISYLLISLIITVTLGVYFFSRHSLSDVFSAIGNVPFVYIISFLCFSAMMNIFRTWRYYLLLLLNGYKTPLPSLFFITIIRNLFADLLPARLGTLIYVYLVRTRLGVPLSAGTSSFTYSFLFDLIGNCPVILFCIISLTIPKEIPHLALILGVFILFSVTTLVIFMLPWCIQMIVQLSKNSKNSYVLKLNPLMEDIRASLLDVKQSGMFHRILLISVAIRIFKYAGLYVFLLGLGVSLGLDKKMLDPGISLIGLLSAEMAASLPISGIAGFGAYEGTWAFVFSLLGIDTRLSEITAFSHHLFTQTYAYLTGIAAMLLLLLPYFYRSETHKKQHALSSRSVFASRYALIFILGTLISLFPLYSFAELDTRRSHGTNKRNEITDKNSLHSKDTFDYTNAENSLQDNTLPDIIFDSNRGGTFGIYGYYLKSEKIVELVSTSQHEMFPDTNIQKDTLIFSRHLSLLRNGPSDVILKSLKDGSEKYIDQGVFPTFSSDGKKIYYEQDRKRVMRYDLETGSIDVLFPNHDDNFGSFQVVKPRVSKDNKILVFTSDKGGRWHTWKVDLQTREQTMIGHGCEAVPHPTEEMLIWVSEKNMNERSGFTALNLRDRKISVFHDEDAPWGHEYFPSFSRDGKQLIYSASPPGQHSHEHAEYQIFIKDLDTKELKRITNDTFTNRWPKFTY